MDDCAQIQQKSVTRGSNNDDNERPSLSGQGNRLLRTPPLPSIRSSKQRIYPRQRTMARGTEPTGVSARPGRNHPSTAAHVKPVFLNKPDAQDVNFFIRWTRAHKPYLAEFNGVSTFAVLVFRGTEQEPKDSHRPTSPSANCASGKARSMYMKDSQVHWIRCGKKSKQR